MEYPCDDGSDAGDERPAEPWWASNAFQAILAVVGLLGSAAAAGYTYYRVRARRRALTDALAAIEGAYAGARSDPAECAARLAELRAHVRAQHDKGRLDDAHFLELDRRAASYLARLRLLELDRRFGHLPPLLLAEIRRLLADGTLSATEADLIEVRAAAYRVPDAARAELVALTRAWAEEDVAGERAAPAPAQTRPL
jgi:type II secretory pathway pseudopilin PulG